MSRQTIKQLLALRSLEEERSETEANRQRRLRQLYLNKLRDSEERSVSALRTLNAALHSGDRVDAISAEMALAFGPLERNALQRQITHLAPIVEAAAATWRNARMRRMQIQTLADAAEAKLRREMELREQKALDAWFLAGQIRRNANERFQRQGRSREDSTGTARAESSGE